MTQNILNALLNGQPLTHIEDVDGIWEKCTMPDGRPETYQCKRMSSLFKEIYANGTVKYNDVNVYAARTFIIRMKHFISGWSE